MRADAIADLAAVGVFYTIIQKQNPVLQAIGQGEDKFIGIGASGLCIGGKTKCDGMVTLSDNREIGFLTETMLFHFEPFSFETGSSVAAIADYGKKKRRAALPDIRIALPDVFLSTGIF